MIGYLIDKSVRVRRADLPCAEDYYMKIRRRKRYLLCAAAALLVLGDCSGTAVCAAQTLPPVTLSSDASMPETLLDVSGDDILPMLDPGLSDEELRAYYGDSVFIGDSIMLGFRNYSAKQETYVHDIQFLAAGSYGVNNALKPVKGDNVHPKYNGQKYQLWDAIPLIGSKRAFIMFGMNDIAPLGLEGARDKYNELIDKILETSPDLEIHIISMTYTLKGKGKKVLNNTNIDAYNLLLQEMAEENGWKYIDLCTVTSDGEGNLAADCCSDGFVHLTKTAYTLWEAELINYANAVASEEEEAAEGTQIPADALPQ